MWRQLLLPLTHTDVKEIGGCWRSLCWQLSPTALSTEIYIGVKEAHHHCIPKVPSLAFYCFFSLSLPFVPSHSLFSLPFLHPFFGGYTLLCSFSSPTSVLVLTKISKKQFNSLPNPAEDFLFNGVSSPELWHPSCAQPPFQGFRNGWQQGQPVLYCRRNGLNTLLSVTAEIWDIHSQQ